jgi:uncharacterized protein YebE (UPF0316 family)
MNDFFILYFIAGVVEDFLVTVDLRLIAEKRVIPATLVSFVATLIALFVLYNILARLDAERSVIAIIIYAAGIATGTFLGMKMKLGNKK